MSKRKREMINKWHEYIKEVMHILAGDGLNNKAQDYLLTGH